MKLELDTTKLLGRRLGHDGRQQATGAKIGEAKPPIDVNLNAASK